MSAMQKENYNGANDRQMDGALAPQQTRMTFRKTEASCFAAIQSSPEPLSIVYLDELRLTRDCLTELIQEHCPTMNVTSMPPADYAAECVAPHASLIIFHLHGASIGAAVSMLKFAAPSRKTPILFITPREARSETVHAVEHDAAGIVHSDCSIELLVAAIHLIIAGGRYYPADSITTSATMTKDIV